MRAPKPGKVVNAWLEEFRQSGDAGAPGRRRLLGLGHVVLVEQEQQRPVSSQASRAPSCLCSSSASSCGAVCGRRKRQRQDQSQYERESGRRGTLPRHPGDAYTAATDPRSTHSKFAGTRTGTRGTYSTGSAYNSSSRASLWDESTIVSRRIPLDKLEFVELIGRGGFGEVYFGMYREQKVAIKRLVPQRRQNMKEVENLLEEAKLMASLDHERIVRLVGVAWESPSDLCVVSEFLTGGDLRTLLQRFAEEQRPTGFTFDKIKIAFHVAHAITYMHSLSPIVLHRDLKSKNVLLTDELDAKLTDFGVSRERADHTMTAGVGSSLWMAPEVMLGERYDEKADVFSFGVMLSELDTHELPYSHAVEPESGRKLPDMVVLQMVSTGRVRVDFTNPGSEMAQIGSACVERVPADRPTAAEVLHRLHRVWRAVNE
ncbi:hypothetical protein PINS_up017638 [Pythium insidiosum]|nr:hypothetical protein PINS_up017638 [Pythium insidiosum]